MTIDGEVPETQTDDTIVGDIGTQVAEAEHAAAPVDPIEELAREAGWSPEGRLAGQSDDWRDAKSFVQFGMKRSREGAEELRSLRTEVTRIGRTSDAILNARVSDERERMRAEFAGAVDRQDTVGAERIAADMAKLDEKPAASAGLDPSVNDFVSRNASWFNVNADATAFAINLTGRLAQQGVSQPEQVRQAEEEVKKRFPELFDRAKPEAKPAAIVASPATRTGALASRGKSVNDLPAAARQAGQDFVRRGHVKTLEDYAKVYFERAPDGRPHEEQRAERERMAPPRVDEERRERRRRFDGTLDQSMDMKLAIPQAVLDRLPDHRLRWVNDVGPRIYNLTERDDWDKVSGVEPRPVGTDEHGKPILAHLLAKPKRFDEEDQARKDVARRELELSALQGASVDPNGLGLNAGEVFVPEGNRISASTYSP